jgi:hypothetical protein
MASMWVHTRWAGLEAMISKTIGAVLGQLFLKKMTILCSGILK